MHSAKPLSDEKTYPEDDNIAEDPTPEEKLTNRHARRAAAKRGRLAERAEARAAATAEAEEARAIAAIRAAAAINRKWRSGGI